MSVYFMKILPKYFINSVLFSKETGHLRPIIRHILFDKDMKGRNLFRKITHKKNGIIKKKFSNLQQTINEDNITVKKINIIHMTRYNKEYETSIDTCNNDDMSWECDSLFELIKNRTLSQFIAISISHDNFKKVSGGIQLCVDKELGHFNSAGLDYLHIYPVIPATRLAKKGEDVLVGVSLNGQELPPARMSGLLELMCQLANENYELVFALHHLMGHSPEMIGEMLRQCGNPPAYFWVHDYFSLCRSYTLLRNGIHFCHAPDASSNACMTCIYGEDRIDHTTRVLELLSQDNVIAVFPSNVSREVVAKAGHKLDFDNSIILPHITLEEVYAERNPSFHGSDDITVAFIGTPAHLKGWDVFWDLAKRYDPEGALRFLVFSTKPPVPGNYRWVPVHTTAEAPRAMIDALESHNVDIVIIWPGWAETFSLTTCEAIAGGAYIVTNSWSGNVAQLVKMHSRGTVLDSHSELLDFLSSESLLNAVKFIRTMRSKGSFIIENSMLTYEVVGK